MNSSIAAIILTKNEEIHIARCLNSIKGVCDEIWVIDSFSTDRTCEIAESMGAKVCRHTFENQARQFNWAIDSCPINSGWIWRVDADEYVEPELAEKVARLLGEVPQSVNGVSVNRKIIFMGRPLLHGGWYPAPQVKIIRKGFGCCEQLWMDEHLIASSGCVKYVDADQTDYNMKGLHWWTMKHNDYSGREAVNMLMLEYGLGNNGNGVKPKFFGTEEQRKRWLKLKYAKTPLFVRPFVNFFLRYVFMGGFLDGKEGFIWHVLQGFWYRMLVDAKIYEIKKRFNFDAEKIKSYIRSEYGV